MTYNIGEEMQVAILQQEYKGIKEAYHRLRDEWLHRGIVMENMEQKIRSLEVENYKLKMQGTQNAKDTDRGTDTDGHSGAGD